ncbi:hypothetical protein SCACP_01180 [Sporomusa carbonis]
MRNHLQLGFPLGAAVSVVTVTGTVFVGRIIGGNR